MAQEWLFQVRIKVNEQLSMSLRSGSPSVTATEINEIATKHKLTPVCTFDGFRKYCSDAEQHGIEKFSLYKWTKETIKNSQKAEKHKLSFAFHRKEAQVYEHSVAEAIFFDLKKLLEDGSIEDLKLIDNNPKNNPQPPKYYR